MCHDNGMDAIQKSLLKRWLSWCVLFALLVVSVVAAVGAYNTVYAVPSAASAHEPALLPGSKQVGRLNAVFVGDEFSTTQAVELGGKIWTSEVAAVNNWTEMNWSEPGMGFVHKAATASCKGAGCGNLLDQVPRIVAENPGIIVLAAGSSDSSETPADVSASIETVFDALRIGLPAAQIVAIGPSSSSSVPEASILAIDGFVRSAATKVGATYVSLLSPIAIEADMVSPDGNILSPTGQKALATRISGALGVKD